MQAPAHIQFRNGTPDDAAAVHRLQVLWAGETPAYGFFPATEDEIRSALGPYYLLAEHAGEIVGFIAGTERTSDGLAVVPAGDAYIEVDDLYLAPAWRRQGIGKALLERLLESAKANGIEKTLIYSSVKNIDPVMKFYRREGFNTWFVMFFKDL